MNFRKTIDILIKDLNDLEEIIEDIKNYPGVPEFEAELALSKCKGAKDVLGTLRDIEIRETKEKSSIPERPVIKEAEIKEPERKQTTEIIKEPAEELKHNVVPVPEKQSSKKKIPEKTILADQFVRMSDSFNETLGGAKNDNGISDLISSRPIHSLTDAIGINDRFLFINEIFSGSPEAYDQAILKLDSVKDLSEARTLIAGYTGSDYNNDTVKQLLDLVKRKISSNE
jgi:hypothetical protein